MTASKLTTCWCIAVLLLSCALVADGAQTPKSGAPQQNFAAHRIPNKEIPNFAQVTPNLYRGGQPSEKGLKTISEMGINIVVDVRGAGEAERKNTAGLGMQYVAIPWHCPFPKDSVFAKFIALVRSNPNKKIFVHCRLGDDRGGMMIAAYRMAEQGWTAKQAMDEMEGFGFTRSHHFICPGLAGYEEKFPERFNTSSAFDGLRPASH